MQGSAGFSRQELDAFAFEAGEDLELARQTAKGSVSAFTALYDRHADAVYTLATHMLGADLADEATQEVFLRFWRKGELYDPSRGVFRTWLLAIARNRFLDILRRRSLERRWQVGTQIENLLMLSQAPGPPIEELTWQEQRASALREALNEIPAEQRQVLVLAYFAGMSQSTISKTLGCPLGTVKKRVRLGVQKLRRRLEVLGLFEDELDEGRLWESKADG